MKLLPVLLLLAASLFAADTRPVVRIGITAPLTGDLSGIGQDMVAWRKLAEGELAKRPTRYRYEFFTEDDQLQARLTALAARRLVELNKVNVLLTYGSPAGVAAAPYANSAKVPHMAVAFDPRATVGDYNVSFLMPVPAQTPKFLEMLNKKGYRKLALIAVRNATWQPAIDELHRLSKEGKIEIAYEKIYVPGERDFRLGLQSLPQDQVDAVVLLSWSPEVAIVMKQYKEQGLKKPVISLGGAFVLCPSRELFNGCLDVFFGDFTAANQKNKELIGRSLSSSAGPLIYDEILLLSDIYEKLWKENQLPTSAQVMEQIKSLKDFKGVLGTMSCRPDKFFDMEVNIYRVEGLDFHKVSLQDL